MAALEIHESAVGDQRSQQALIDRVLASQQFRRTVRLRDLLRYVASRSISQPGGGIPETDIGTAVFGRSPNYDTAVDNIVRVSAGDLRRRLEHYFLDEGAHESMMCEMPRGGYALLFRARVSREELPAQPLPTHAGLADSATAESGPEAIPVLEYPEARSPASSLALATSSWRSWLTDPRTLALLTLCGTIAILSAVMLARLGREPWQRSAPLASIWSAFFAQNAEIDIVLADSSLALVKSITGASVDLSEYLGYGYQGLKSDGHFDRSTQTALGYILSRNNGSIGDFRAASNIVSLTAHPEHLVIGSAHDFTPENIKTKNVVLIGSSVSNPWVDLYRDQLSFVLENGTPGSVALIRNLNPQTGEQSNYYVDGQPGREAGLAVIAILSNIEPDRHVLIIEGTDSQATLAASNFVTSIMGARIVAEHLPHTAANAMPNHMEILLRSSKLLATPLQAKILAIHTRND